MALQRLLPQVLAVFAWSFAAVAADPALVLTLMHSNDTHAHIEAFADPIPQGGITRRKTLIEQVRAEVGPDRPERSTLLVDAGDFAMGTPYFNTWEGSESVMAMNDMGYDAATFGNHEFDLGPARLARLLKGEPIVVAGQTHATEKPNFLMVSANVDVTAEPALQGLVFPHAVINKAGNRYGVIGVTAEDLASLSNTGPNIQVRDYIASVNAAAARLTADGIDKIILLSHSGYGVDTAKAGQLAGVDIIVSGHDHALLGDPARIAAATGSPDYGKRSRGPYPTEARNRDGHKVLIVSAYEWGRWLGRLDVEFDAAGHVLGGVDRSLFVDARKVPENPALATKLAAYKAPVDAYTTVVIGSNRMAPSHATPPGPRAAETPLGDLLSDLMEAAAQASDGAVAAFSNGGGLRADLPAGEVTYGHALTVLPFGNRMVVIDLSGRELLEVLERSVGPLYGDGGFLQLSRSLRLRYCAAAQGCENPLLPGGRITALRIAGQPLDLERTYRIATNDYLAGGGNGYTALGQPCKRPGGYCRDTGIVLLDLLVARLKTGEPLTTVVDGRIERH